jgi:hypothetical protein
VRADELVLVPGDADVFLYGPRFVLLVTGYIADSIDAFLTELGTETEAGEDIHLGFTFSSVPGPNSDPRHL